MRQRRERGESGLVSTPSIPNPSIGYCPWAGVPWVMGAAAASLGGGQLVGGFWGPTVSPWHSPLWLGIHGASSPQIHAALAAFIQAPATSCQEPVNEERFFNDCTFNHNDQFVSLSLFKAAFQRGKRLKPFFNEMRSPRFSLACVPLSTQLEKLIIMGFSGPQKQALLTLHSTFHTLIHALFINLFFSVQLQQMIWGEGGKGWHF